tara:strand:+ start:931 stop:1095 length:165 start_codon:yes stop_codon:yes gene_type:complete
MQTVNAIIELMSKAVLIQNKTIQLTGYMHTALLFTLYDLPFIVITHFAEWLHEL